MLVATPIPANRARFSLSEITAATGGQLLARGGGEVCGVATDTRADVSGKLFVALQGEHADGHDFVPAAVERGASGVLVSRAVELPRATLAVRVPCTLTALGALARLHRQRWGGKVVAIGGSAGKTTTRSAVAAVLDAVAPGATHFERGNLNNQIGVPMVLLGVSAQHRFAVVEVGTNQRGEVAQLAGICQPDLALLTLVALEHAAGIGGLEQIEAEEGDLLAAVGATGTVIVNGDDPRALRQLRRSPATTQLRYGTAAGCDYRLVHREGLALAGSRLKIERPSAQGRGAVWVQCPVLGEGGAQCTMAALAVGDQLSAELVDGQKVSDALAAPDVFEPGRLSPLLLGDGIVVLDDTYNANPASVQSSVAAAGEAARARGSRLVLVIGEMRELGACSGAEHRATGQQLGSSGAAALVAVSGDAEQMVQPAQAQGMEAVYACDAEAALPLVLARVRSGDVVLVKASRGVRAERVVVGLRQAKGMAT